jgi:cytochrome b pre-mRNA-processing protein 3
MLHLLFPRLTADPARGAELFDWITGRAREEHWYISGGVPDTIDGRFAMLATIAALVMVRLEREGDSGNRLTAALTERFVEVMEAEHREMGLGDPTLGKTVRKLLVALARRLDLWRTATGRNDWETATLQSVFGGADVSPSAAGHAAAALREFWRRLDSSPLGAIARGRVE